MKRTGSIPPQNPQGSALVLSLIFIAVFSALATALAVISETSVQLADNLRRADATRGCAESGLEVVRYWLSRVQMSGTIAPSDRFNYLANTFQGELSAAGITNIVPVQSGSTLTMSDIPLKADGSEKFSAVLTGIDANTVQVDVTGYVTGSSGALQRRIRSNCRYFQRADTVFDYGVASKGPVSLSGNIELEGVNIAVESNAYIECDSLLALEIIGNSMIAGDVKIVNPLAYVHLQGGHAGVGGETGEAALEHIDIGAPPTSFPEMNPSDFFHYANNELSASADLSTNATYNNLRIPPNRNPHFSGNATLRGVIYVQSPNVVSFSGNVDVTAIIVTDGDPNDNSGTNRLTFTGNITGHAIDQLPQEEQFQGLHEQTGTFILAPGFHLGFGGSFTTLCGAIAANGIELWGNAGGTINGSIINYSSAPITLSGNSDLHFNRSGLDQVPAGFVPRIIMQYNASTYTEPPA